MHGKCLLKYIYSFRDVSDELIRHIHIYQSVLNKDKWLTCTVTHFTSTVKDQPQCFRDHYRSFEICLCILTCFQKTAPLKKTLVSQKIMLVLCFYLQCFCLPGRPRDSQWSWYHWRDLHRFPHTKSDLIQPVWSGGQLRMLVFQI